MELVGELGAGLEQPVDLLHQEGHLVVGGHALKEFRIFSIFISYIVVKHFWVIRRKKVIKKVSIFQS